MSKQHFEFLEQTLGDGMIAFPKLLFTDFRALNLSLEECFLLMELWYLKFEQSIENPGEGFLSKAIGKDEGEVMLLLSNLIEKNFLSYEEDKEEIVYSLTPLIDQLFRLWVDGTNEATAAEKKLQMESKVAEKEEESISQSTLYQLFEGEFGRPLSPMEIDFLSEWLHVRKFSQKMIEEALKEAVLHGKVSFKYVDRILLDWDKKGVLNARENQSLKKSKGTKSISTPAKTQKTVSKKTKKNNYDDFLF